LYIVISKYYSIKSYDSSHATQVCHKLVTQ